MARPRRPVIQPVVPGRTWTCRWEGCPDYGTRFLAPEGKTNAEDCQHHHQTVHGVHPQRPGAVPTGRLTA